jgi:hypothetical protein
MGYFSNGTEGMIYEETYCQRCVHSDLGEGKEIGVDPPCPIWMAHFLFAYEECNSTSNAKTMLDMLIPRVPHTFSDGITHEINGECAMFVLDQPSLFDAEGATT